MTARKVTARCPLLQFELAQMAKSLLDATLSSNSPCISVELRRHHAGRTMRWTPRIIDKDNGAVAQIVRNNIVAADIVRK